MFSHLHKAIRVRSALAVAALYAFCVLAPHAALALGNGAASAHCLTETSGLNHAHKMQAAIGHSHADGSKHVHHAPAQATQHTHSDGTDHDHGKPGKTTDAGCCGIFCITALASDGTAVLPAPPPRAPERAALQPERTSHSPDRIYEPPIG